MKTINALLFTLLFSFSLFSQGNGYLGISMKKANGEGVRISEVLENGSALVYGLKQNDVILSIDGVVVNTATQLKNQIVSKDWGESIEVVYNREGHSRSQNVVLGNRAYKIKYHVKRKKINSSYEWSFDDNTWITILDGVATKIVKINSNGEKVSHDIVEGEEVPQAFYDLGDKLEIVEAIDLRNANKRFYPSITVYIKTYAKTSKVAPTKTSNNSALKVYPNPSLGEFQFSLTMENPASKIVTWQIFDVSGKKIKEGEQNDFNGLFNQKIDLTSQEAGVYLLRVINEKEVMTERLIIN